MQTYGGGHGRGNGTNRPKTGNNYISHGSYDEFDDDYYDGGASNGGRATSGASANYDFQVRRSSYAASDKRDDRRSAAYSQPAQSRTNGSAVRSTESRSSGHPAQSRSGSARRDQKTTQTSDGFGYSDQYRAETGQNLVPPNRASDRTGMELRGQNSPAYYSESAYRGEAPAAAYQSASAYSDDVETYGGTRNVNPSRDIAFRMPRSHSFRNTVIAFVLVLTMSMCGFIGSKSNAKKNSASKPAAATSQKQDTAPSETQSEPVVIPAVISSLVINTAAPIFGTSRLMIDVEVDKDCYIRVEIVDSMGNVFATPYDGFAVDAGKQRLYFNGTDASGNWIVIGEYKVKVSVLTDESDKPAASESEAPSPSETAGVDTKSWKVSSSKTVDFSVTTNPYRTPVAYPTKVPTAPSESETPTPSESESPTPGTPTPGTPTPGTPTPGTPTPGTPTPGTPTPETPTPGTPSPDPDPGEGEGEIVG